MNEWESLLFPVLTCWKDMVQSWVLVVQQVCGGMLEAPTVITSAALLPVPCSLCTVSTPFWAGIGPPGSSIAVHSSVSIIILSVPIAQLSVPFSA